MAMGIAISVTNATDLWAAVKALRQIVTLPLATAKAAVQEHGPIPLNLPWATRLSGSTRDLILRQLSPYLNELTTMLDRLAKAGATAKILIDGEQFDHYGLAKAVAQAEADWAAQEYHSYPDSDLFRIANGQQPGEREVACKELGLRLHDADGKELIWRCCAHSPPLRRHLALLELKRRGVDLKSLSDAAGPCPHPRWQPTSDRYHECSFCGVTREHDWKGNVDAGTYGHGCSMCGYFEDD